MKRRMVNEFTTKLQHANTEHIMTMRLVCVEVFKYFFKCRGIYFIRMKDKDSFYFREHSDGIFLLLLVRVHCLEE